MLFWVGTAWLENKSGFKKEKKNVRQSFQLKTHSRLMRVGHRVLILFQHRLVEDGHLVFRPSLKLRNRTRLRLFSSSFLAWNSPWILKPRCTTKAELSTENLYPATWSSQAWGGMRRPTWCGKWWEGKERRWEERGQRGGKIGSEEIIFSDWVILLVTSKLSSKTT